MADTHLTPDARRGFALLIASPGLDREAFEEYWLDRHGPLVAAIPGYARYRQRYVQDHLAPGLALEPAFPFAGVASVVHPAIAGPDFTRTESYRDRVEPDERRFLDRNRSVAFAAHEFRFLGGAGLEKVLTFGRIPVGSSREEFVRDILPTYSAAVTESADAPAAWSMSVALSDPISMNGRRIPAEHQIDWVNEWWFESSERAQDFLAFHHDPGSDVGRLVRTRWSMRSSEYVLFDADSQ